MRLMWLTLLALASSQSVEAAVRYIAFGDSITAGAGAGFVFDTDPQANCNVPDQCGFVWRLEDSLNAAGINAVVVNRGLAGEQTPEGLSRINSVISSSDDVVILMEGTNDVGQFLKSNGIAMGAVRDNLRTMVDIATAKGLDTLVSTVIRRVCKSPPNNYVGGSCTTFELWSDEPVTIDLRDKILAMASGRDRASANPHSGITQISKYWTGDLFTGHLDGDGYDSLAPIFHGKIVAAPALASPNPAEPVGDVLPDSVFVWNNQSGATLYQLEVDGPALGGTHLEWYEDADVCSGSDCTVDLGTLVEGQYSWRVRSRNLRGPSSWSAWTDFDVIAVPTAPVLTSPPPDVYSTGRIVTYTWVAQPSTDTYRLLVENSLAVVVLDQVVTAATACTGASCSATPAALPVAGSYKWRLSGSNGAGTGPLSSRLAFDLIDAVPTAANPLYPLDDVFTTTPTFGWVRRFGATDFTLQLDGATTLFDDSICAGDACSTIQAAPLAVGAHTWRVRSRNALGGGAWTADIIFDVLECSAPVSVTLDSTDTGGPVFDYQFCETITAGSGYTVQNAESVTFHAGGTVELEDGFSVQTGATFRARVDR